MATYMYFQFPARHALYEILSLKNSSMYNYIKVPEVGGTYLV